MKRSSLTLRVLIGALIWIALALGAGSYAVLEVFKASALRQFDQRLQDELTLLSVGIATTPDDPGARMTSPSFSRVYSGLYWQTQPEGGPLFRSRSLWDQALPVEEFTDTVEGPDGQLLRLLMRQVSSPDGRRWNLAVAADLAKLEQETTLFKTGVLPAVGWLALGLIVAAGLVLRTALAPLRQLRSEVRDLQTREDPAINQNFPAEVAPLVEDLNAMLEKNTRLRERGRAQAANLAHALKTPAAILQNEIDRARQGQALDIELSAQAVRQIADTAHRHVSQSGSGPDTLPEGSGADGVAVLSEVVQAVRRLFPGVGITVNSPERLKLAMTVPDQHEIYGNLLENACKWARSEIRASLKRDGHEVAFTVEDDGPGVPEAERERILRQGVRLDETKQGSGLGLAIVEDIAARYEGELSLGSSRLGGLCVRVSLPQV